MKPTNVPQFISELGAGVVEEKLAHMISEVATQVVALDKMGEITLNIKLKKLGDSDQLKVEHKLAYKRPKKRGSISEDDTQESMMFGNRGLIPSFRGSFDKRLLTFKSFAPSQSHPSRVQLSCRSFFISC